MGREISLFSGYSSQENRLTNYTMLLVRFLYEESPELYERFLVSLFGQTIEARPKFSQQEYRKTSIPDAVIAQKPYCVFIETKTFDWFYDDQLDRHLDNLEQEGAGLKLLVALSNFDSKRQQELTSTFQSRAALRSSNILFKALSFRDFLECFPKVGPETFLSRAKAEYEMYLEEEQMLGTWEEWLDVVNCASWPEHFTDHLVYTCPMYKPAYSHMRCRFLGQYSNKQVSNVAFIRGVVEFPKDGAPLVKWVHDGTPDDALISEARERAQKAWGNSPEDLRVFVLGPPSATRFEKTTPGAMYTSRQYFNLKSLKTVKDADDLAQQLFGKSWQDLTGPS